MNRTTIDLNYSSEKKIAIAIGFFDGVHLGHRKLFDEVIGHREYLPSVLTFTMGQKSMVKPSERRLILTDEERTEMFSAIGIKNILEMPFDEKLMHTSKEDFISFLKKLNAKVIVVGSDFTFGEHALGKAYDLLVLKQYGIEVIIKDLLCSGDRKLASSDIMKMIASGNLKEANSHLGYEYFVTAQRDGNLLVFPQEKVRLPDGTYKCRIGDKDNISSIFEEDGKSYIKIKKDDFSFNQEKVIKISFLDRI